MAAAKGVANQLQNFAIQRFNQIASELHQDIGSLGTGYNFSTNPNIAGDQIANRAAAVQGSGQIPDFNEYSTYVALYLNTGQQTVLAISFHALGLHIGGSSVWWLTWWPGPKPEKIRGGTFQIN